MSSKIFNKYLGISRFSKDVRKQNLIDDNIDSKKWEYNVVYLGRNLHRTLATVSMTEDEELISKKSDPEFKEIAYNLGLGLGDYPQALNIYDMYWYIAAYPDVVSFFYPSLDMSTESEQRIPELNKKRDKSHGMLDDYEGSIDIENTTPLDYFLGLKNYYKTGNKLSMVRKTKS